MEDIILKKFFDPARWEYAIEKGCIKGVSKARLYQLCKPEERVRMYLAMKNGTYEIAPPHIALIPKDDGTNREVCVNEPDDRVVCSIANDLLFELMPDMVHPCCKSYQKGIGCGKVVQEISHVICNTKPNANGFIGWKADLSKYFDSVPIEYIDQAFDCVEDRHGRSVLIDVLRKYYHSDIYITVEKTVDYKYRSLKQGCAVAAWLADVVLYHIDERISALDVLYKRYSDDICCIGPDADKAMQILEEELGKMQMKLNPKKVEWLDAQHWFKFLGFSIKGASISLSSTRIKKFQKEIEKRTIDRLKVPQRSAEGRLLPTGRKKSQKSQKFMTAINAVNRYLYHGDGQGHSWATQVLSVVNVKQDIDTMNAFVMDCLRAVHTGKTKIGGLGYDKQGKTGCVVRGRGRNVSANRRKTGDTIDGYLTLGCMQNAMRTSKAAYETLVRSLSISAISPQTSDIEQLPVCVETIEELYDIYKHSIPSEKTMNRVSRFKALPESELTDDDMLYGVEREQAEKDLEQALQGFAVPEDAGSWFWQSKNDKDLVVLKSWVHGSRLMINDCNHAPCTVNQ